MVVVFDSLTGQTKRFSESLGFPTYNIKDYEGNKQDKIFLITRSFNFGEVTKVASEFLNKYHNQVVGVAVSGNRNWGTNYGAAGDKISAQYNIPLVLKFEGSGLPHERDIIKKWLDDNK